jgi:adenylate cyclase
MNGAGFLMIGGVLLLCLYMLLAKRSRFLPFLPLGFLIVFFAIEAVSQFVGHLPIVLEYEKWIDVASAIILSWAIIRLVFALLVELPLKYWKEIEIPHITRDFILLICYAILFFILLRARGDVNLAGLITTSAALTVVIGLAAQSTLGNFFSGLVLQMEHPFSIGDWITYGSHTGRVIGITWKSTRIKTRDDVLIYLPNNELSNVSLHPDPDGIFRKVDLLSIFDDKVLPSLGLGAFLAANPRVTLEFRPRHLKVGERNIPIDANGDAILRYRGPSGTHRTYSAAAVLQSEIQLRNGEQPNIRDPKAFKDKFVVFGFSAPGLYDLRPSPISGVYPGAEIYATLLDNFLSGDFMRQFPVSMMVPLLLMVSLICAVSVTYVKNVPGSIIAIAIFIALPVLISLGAYQQGFWLPLVVQEIAIVVTIGFVLIINFATEGRQKRFIKNAFKHFLSPAVIEQLIVNPERLKLGGERRLLSIFFSDLQGFTSISENLDPETLIELLNDYLTAMTDIIHDEGGTIDKYEGDAIIAFWKAPLEISEHAVKAVRAAMRCQAKLQEMRPAFRKQIEAELHMRIGIHTGIAVVGNLGSHNRFDYTIIGDAVNLAARLEGANKQFGTFTMISQSTCELVNQHFNTRELARLAVVGRKEPVTVYEPMISVDDDAVKDILDKFNQALGLFYKGDMVQAEKAFAEIQTRDPAALAYAQKCRTLFNTELKNWQGVWVMQSK